MHQRNIQLLFQLSFDVKTFGGFDIFQVDATKRWLQRFDDLHKFFRILFIDLDVEHVDIGKNFE